MVDGEVRRPGERPPEHIPLYHPTTHHSIPGHPANSTHRRQRVRWHSRCWGSPRTRPARGSTQRPRPARSVGSGAPGPGGAGAAAAPPAAAAGRCGWGDEDGGGCMGVDWQCHARSCGSPCQPATPDARLPLTLKARLAAAPLRGSITTSRTHHRTTAHPNQSCNQVVAAVWGDKCRRLRVAVRSAAATSGQC